MPQRTFSLRKQLRKRVINTLIRDFRLHKPEKTRGEEVRDIVLSWIKGIGLPIISTFIVLSIRLRFTSFLADATFILFFPSIIVVSWIAGLYSGIIATIFGAIAALYFVSPPLTALPLTSQFEFLLITYLIEGAIMSYFIANQRNAKSKAEDVQQSFQLLMENTIDYGIIFLDKRGYITNSNYGAYKLTGYHKSDLVGRFFSILFTKEGKAKKLYEKEYITALRKGRSEDDNYLQKKNGTDFFASGFTTSLWTQNNQLRGFVKLFRDVTQTKRLENEKEDFISIAAHELRNPVSSINLYLQMLQKYYKNNPNKEAQNYVQKASEQLQRLLDLITTLLDVSQIQQGTITLNKEAVDMNTLINQLIDNIQSSEKQHKIIKKGTIKTKIIIDKRKIEEVMINLINNAIKYSPKAKQVVVTLKNKQKEISISVTDFGIGMSNDVATKVFERFYRGKQKHIGNIPGLGLGLYISSQIVHAHGGHMSVTSSPEKGSTFAFTIPKT